MIVSIPDLSTLTYFDFKDACYINDLPEAIDGLVKIFADDTKVYQAIESADTPEFQFFNAVFASKGYHFKDIFDFTTAGDWDCVAAVEHLPALHYSVDFIFLSFGIMCFIDEL